MRLRLLIGLLVAGLAALSGRPGAAQEPNRAGLIVSYGDGRTDARCVSFDEAEISGYEALRRSGLTVDARFEGMGSLVCRIGNTGCPASDCLCECQGGSDCTYWSYWHLGEEGWHYSPIGASAYQVRPGTVEGWSWGPGAASAAVAPQATTFAEVCSAASVSPGQTRPAAERAPAGWWSYAALAAIVAGLGGAALLSRRKRR